MSKPTFSSYNLDHMKEKVADVLNDRQNLAEENAQLTAELKAVNADLKGAVESLKNVTKERDAAKEDAYSEHQKYVQTRTALGNANWRLTKLQDVEEQRDILIEAMGRMVGRC